MAIISGSGVLKVTVLWIAVIASAVAITYFSHLCREQYTQLTALQREANELQVQYGRYLLEQSAWGRCKGLSLWLLVSWVCALLRLMK